MFNVQCEVGGLVCSRVGSQALASFMFTAPPRGGAGGGLHSPPLIVPQQVLNSFTHSLLDWWPTLELHRQQLQFPHQFTRHESMVCFRQHCRFTICIELVELTNSVSDDKIQKTILILRRGALSSLFQLYDLVHINQFSTLIRTLLCCLSYELPIINLNQIELDPQQGLFNRHIATDN